MGFSSPFWIICVCLLSTSGSDIFLLSRGDNEWQSNPSARKKYARPSWGRVHKHYLSVCAADNDSSLQPWNCWWEVLTLTVAFEAQISSPWNDNGSLLLYILMWQSLAMIRAYAGFFTWVSGSNQLEWWHTLAATSSTSHHQMRDRARNARQGALISRMQGPQASEPATDLGGTWELVFQR